MNPTRHIMTFSLQYQKGITLMTTLIFLVVLSMIGVAVARQNQMEERMVGNSRNRDLAFQAAEAVLAQAEANLAAGENWSSGAWDGTRAGYREYNAMLENNANYWNTNSLWVDTSSHKVTLSITQDPTRDIVRVPPQLRYIVDRFNCVGLNRSYRITVRGLGGDSLFDSSNTNCGNSAADSDCYDYNAVVILQSKVRYDADPSC